MCTLCDCRWAIVTDRHSWNVSTQNAFSLLSTAILVNCAPSGEMHNYCTPHIIKENSENFLIHRCNCVLLFQLYCVWQVVKTPTVILHNPVYSVPTAGHCCVLRPAEGQTERLVSLVDFVVWGFWVSSLCPPCVMSPHPPNSFRMWICCPSDLGVGVGGGDSPSQR